MMKLDTDTSVMQVLFCVCFIQAR